MRGLIVRLTAGRVEDEEKQFFNQPILIEIVTLKPTTIEFQSPKNRVLSRGKLDRG